MRFFKVFNSEEFGEILVLVNPALNGSISVVFSGKEIDMVMMAAVVDRNEPSMAELSDRLEKMQLSDILPLVESSTMALTEKLTEERNTNPFLN